MRYQIEICMGCNIPKPVNSRHLCADCVFKGNHNGKTKFEVRLRRINSKDITHVNKTYIKKVKSLKQAENASILRKAKNVERATRILNDEALYYYAFTNLPHWCQECGVDLPEEFRDSTGRIICRSQYSHILSKGSHPEFRHNINNINRLCPDHHHIWEFGDRTKMKIYTANQVAIQKMIDEKNS